MEEKWDRSPKWFPDIKWFIKPENIKVISDIEKNIKIL